MPNDFNDAVIAEFRANSGQVGGFFEGARLLLLTTTGARTGNPHTTPLGYLPDGDGRVLVIGSAGGSPRHPQWYRNIQANPLATVEDGVFTYEAKATIVDGPTRDAAFARAVEADPGWADYQEKAAGRVIPVVALEPAVAGPPPFRSLADALLQVHGAFRRELRLIRAEIARSGSGIGAQLRITCLSLCAGLRNHHVGEDTMVFPMLAKRYPELADVLDRLGREHEQVAASVERLKALLEGNGETLLPEFDRIAAELEAHLSYEEEQLLPLL
ncbi:nitroreductase/quinone reductase family protein [Actinokineospora auranticolor]|uniref:Deazaflavin-dependent oxidoreductase (Nitroreductase family) n=1 Tax=Actinokineospora auranticolor TaxID=155976 RepID=A0A2S6H1G9_9PSEU|nr:nitroreductase/quinone reductase family protein [Actinokineospora auranticolor]PPK71325.1 deazaflavin-dependent oxidoreductase (nitroreductase family) [Actinokineospora auranticolor]